MRPTRAIHQTKPAAKTRIIQAAELEPEKDPLPPNFVWHSLALSQHPGHVARRSHSYATPAGAPVTDEGQPLDPLTRAHFEPRIGRDLGNVRVHTDSSAAEFAHDHAARAVTLGHHIYFSTNRHSPGTVEGQRLISHELAHIARAGPAGPPAPMLDPDPPEVHDQRLREMIVARRFRPNSFWSYLQTHPDSLDVAESVLVDGLTTMPDQRRRLRSLMTGFVNRFQSRRGNVEAAISTATEELRASARQSVQTMWTEYESAAVAYAVLEWATTRRDEQRRLSRRGRRRGERVDPSPLEVQYEEWRAAANERYQEMRARRGASFDTASNILSNLMDASSPLSYVQENLLNELSDFMQGGIAAARRNRLRSWEAVEMHLYSPSERVLERYTNARSRRDTARASRDSLRAERQRLETAPEGETSRAESRRRRDLRRVQRAERRANTEATRAERAMTSEGATDPEMRQLLEWFEDDVAETEQRVHDYTQRRDERLAGALPTAAHQGLELNTVISDSERWYIYYQALMNISNGFPGFSQERTVQTVLGHRSRIAADRRGAGIASDVSVGTYSGHGEGQYDIMARAGSDVLSVQPDTINLTRVLGPGPQGTTRTFTREESTVRSLSEITAESADADVLAKLVYGFFGRSWSREQVAAYFEGNVDDLPNRAPDASRVIAGLVFENTIAGSTITQPIEAARTRIRGQLEEAMRADLASRGIVVPAGTPILRTVDASTGSFAGVTMVAWRNFETLTNPRTGRIFTRNETVATVLGSARRVLMNDSAVITAVEGLIRTLRSGGREGGRSGPAVEIIHRYREASSGEQVWIVVAYRHLHEIAPGLAANQAVTPRMLIAEVGSSGNAVSPHVHMSISVFEQNPGRFTRRPPIGFLEPLDFFPMMRRGAVGAPPPAAAPGDAPPATPPATPGATPAAPPQTSPQPE